MYGIGFIEASLMFTADTDGDAKAIVERNRDGRPMELWCGARVVERFEARPT